MKKILYCIYVITLCGIAPQNILSQIANERNYAPNYSPISPEAAALNKSITYPVSHGTGLVDVKIPLYNVQIGDITVPIYLQYHSSGIKVQSPFSWVGAGWTLVAEPSISRVVEGLVDEKHRQATSIILNDVNSKYNWLNNNTIDLMPDNYFYKLSDKSGSFHFDYIDNANKNIIIHPFEPITVREVLNGMYDSKFTITDEKGIVYYFGEDIERTLYTDGTGIPCNWKCSKIETKKTNSTVEFNYYENIITDYLPNDYVKIVQRVNRSEEWDPSTSCDIKTFYANGVEHNKAALIYDSYSGITKTLSETGQLFDDVMNMTYYENNKINIGYGIIDQYFPVSVDINQSRTDRFIINKSKIHQLNEIKFGDYSITFNRKSIGDNYFLLDNIEIKDNDKLIRKIKFNLTHLGLSTDNGLKKESLYKLDGLEIIDSKESKTDTYRFEYYEPDNFPSRWSRNVDFWGYSNALPGASEKSMVPIQSGIFLGIYGNSATKEITIGASHREANNYAITGSLKGITYPTGGKTTFVYELNKYKYKFKQGSTTLYEDYDFGGGLRIKEIIENPMDVNSRIITKRYEYSDGICNKSPLRYHEDDNYPLVNYFSDKTTTITKGKEYDNLGHYCTDAIVNHWTYYANALTDLNTASGAPVVYNKVSEYINEELKSTYFYNYFLDNTPEQSIKVNHQNDWSVGKIDSIIQYKKFGNEYQRIKKQEYQYTTYNQTITQAYVNDGNLKFIDYTGYVLPTYPGYNYNYYYSYYNNGCLLLTKKIDTQYDDNQKKIISIEQNEYKNPNSSENICSLCYPRIVYNDILTRFESGDEFKKEIVREEYLYTNDLTLTGLSEEARQKLIENGAIGTLLEKTTTRGEKSNIFSEDEGKFIENYVGRPISSTRYDYRVFDNNTFPQLSTINIGKDKNSREERVNIIKYNKYGKPMHISQDNTNDIVYLWAFGGEYLIAEIKNATYADVKSALGYSDAQIEDLAANYTPNVLQIRDKLDVYFKSRTALVNTYTYKPLVGMTSQTNPRGITTYYKYDDFNRLEYTYIIENGEKKILQKNEYHYTNQQ